MGKPDVLQPCAEYEDHQKFRSNWYQNPTEIRKRTPTPMVERPNYEDWDFVAQGSDLQSPRSKPS